MIGINKKKHVYADYTYVPLVLAAPVLAGFGENKPAALVCRAFALSALSYSLCTKAKWGLVKWIPYRVHAGLDLTSGVLAFAAVILPLIRRDKPARNTFILMGITGVLVGALSLAAARKSTKTKNL